MKAIVKENYFYLTIIIFILGLSWPINKLGISNISPIWFSSLRLIVATISMFIVVILLKKLIIPKKKDLPIILCIGLLQRGIFLTLISIGLSYSGAGQAATLVYTTPIWVGIIEQFILRNTLNIRKWIGILISVIGICIFIAPWKVKWSIHHLIGIIILLLAAISWSISILCTRYMKWTKNPLELSPWQLLAGTIPVLIYTILVDFHGIKLIDFTNIGLLLELTYTGIFATAFAFYLTSIVGQNLPPITVSLNFLIIPIVGYIFSIFLLHETITLQKGFGICLLISGYLLIIILKK